MASGVASDQLLAGLIRQSRALTADQQLRLATYLVEQARSALHPAQPQTRWRDLRGLFPYPMLGEDAQTWVSRLRREGQEQRERQWRPPE